MPEILTRHPDVVLSVLKGSGAQCGVGVKPQILTACPAERFCALSEGELCVYGLGEVSQMTQVSRQDLCGALAGGCSATPVLGALALVWGLRRARRRRSRATAA